MLRVRGHAATDHKWEQLPAFGTFPRRRLAVDSPGLVRLRVAASRRRLVQRQQSRVCKTAAHFREFFVRLDLNAEVVDTRLRASLRDGEVDLRVGQLPFAVVGFQDGWLDATKHRGIKPRAVREVFNGEVDVHALHDLPPQHCGDADTEQPAPAQQFSVRKPMRPFMASKLAE